MAKRLSGLFLGALLAAVAMACGGDSGPTAPSGGGGGGGGGTVAATITITSTGVSNRDVTVPVGSRVTFVNNDTRSHQINSNPHPTHGDCPGIDTGISFIAVGQSKTSDNLNAQRVCGYHDHNEPDNAALQGVIRVQ